MPDEKAKPTSKVSDSVVDVTEQGASLAQKRVRLLLPFGFVDENDRNRFWKAGEVVADASEIAVLASRSAPVEDVA